MIFAKSTRYGLDTKIYRLQEVLQDELPWFDNVADADVEIYGKLYRNIDSNGNTIAEAYVSGNEYTQVFVNDKVAATIGFLVTGNRNLTDYVNSANLDIVCSVRLDKIYGANTRDDEKALFELIKVIRTDNSVLGVNEAREGIANVFSGFYTESIRFNGMQPWYVFAVNVDVEYVNDLCP